MAYANQTPDDYMYPERAQFQWEDVAEAFCWEQCFQHKSCKGWIALCRECNEDANARSWCARAQGAWCKGARIYCQSCTQKVNYDLISMKQADENVFCEHREGHLLLLKALHESQNARRSKASSSSSPPSQIVFATAQAAAAGVCAHHGGVQTPLPPAEPALAEQVRMLQAQNERQQMDIQNLQFILRKLIEDLGACGSVDAAKFYPQ